MGLIDPALHPADISMPSCAGNYNVPSWCKLTLYLDFLRRKHTGNYFTKLRLTLRCKACTALFESGQELITGMLNTS